MIYLAVIIVYLITRHYVEDLVTYLFYAELLAIVCTVIVFSIGGVGAAESLAPAALTGFILMFFEVVLKMFSGSGKIVEPSHPKDKSHRR